MPLINQQIPSQSFELVRDRIGLILADELIHQFESGWSDLNVRKVWIERAIPFDKKDPISINVRFNTEDYSNRNYTTVDGECSYLVDYYASAPGNDTENGDRLAAIKIQSLMGKSRAILSNPAYATLGFPRGFIGSVTVNSIAMGSPADDPELKNIARGQLQVTVRVLESELLKTPPDLSLANTSVKLYNTNKGFVYMWDSDSEIDQFTNQFTNQFK